jgi:uncharacterized protein YbaR (Trm112 family)
LDDELLNLIVCPETRAPLERAESVFLAKVNDAIRRGGVRNRGGDLVSKPLDEVLVRMDRLVFYPVIEGIPVLLVDEGIETSQLE